MATEITRAGLAAQLGAETAGGNGAGAVESMGGAEVTEADGYGLPAVESQVADNTTGGQAPSAFGRKPKAAPATSPAGAQAQINRALPPPQQVRISKRVQGGKYVFINSFGPSEIGTEAGAWQVFIKRHLKSFLDSGENWFLIESVDAQGKLRSHGEHAVAGDMPAVAQVTPGAGTTIYPPQTDTVRDQIAAMREMEELSEKRRQAWKAEQDQIRQENERARLALEAATQGGKTDPMMTFMMTQMMQRQTTPPPRDVRDEAEFIERQIERRMAPMAAGMNSIAERLERLAQAAANPPPILQPPPDPMKTVADLVIALKPAPPPEPKDQFTMRDFMAMQQQSETRMDRLLTLMKPEAPKETFGLRDWIQMQQSQEDRTQRLLERMEANTERRLADLKEIARDKPKGNTTLEALREAKEIAGLLGGEVAPEGTIGKILELATSGEFWSGFSDFVATVKGGGAEEDEETEESPPIQVEDRTPRAAAPPAPRPTQNPPAAAPAPAKSRAAAPAGVKPADMGLTDYPPEVDAAAAQLATVSVTEAVDAEGTQAQIVAVMAVLQAAMNGSTEWKRRVFTGLRKVALGGPKQVPIWIGPFLRGLTKSGKLTLSACEILEKNLSVNSEAIVGWIKRKMTQPSK